MRQREPVVRMRGYRRCIDETPRRFLKRNYWQKRRNTSTRALNNGTVRYSVFESSQPTTKLIFPTLRRGQAR